MLITAFDLICNRVTKADLRKNEVRNEVLLNLHNVAGFGNVWKHRTWFNNFTI